MLKARHAGDLETEKVVQSVAEGMLTITDTRGQDAVEDWEVDELLEWTNGLNFDQYVDHQLVFLFNFQTLFCMDLLQASTLETRMFVQKWCLPTGG